MEKLGASLFFRPRRRDTRAPMVSGVTPRRLTIESGGELLAVFSWGEGPIVLLAHGWEGHAGQMTAFVPPLLAAGFRVVAFDMPAHARSSGHRVSVLDMARAIRDVADEVAPLFGAAAAPLHAVIGHSLGATAAALAIHDGLAVRRAVLLAPAAEPTLFAQRAAAFLGLDGDVADGMVRRVCDELGGDVTAIDVRNLAAGMNLPAMVLADPDDEEIPSAHFEAIAYAWPRARFQRIEGAGHYRILRDRRAVEAAVSFVAEEGAAALLATG